MCVRCLWGRCPLGPFIAHAAAGKHTRAGSLASAAANERSEFSSVLVPDSASAAPSTLSGVQATGMLGVLEEILGPTVLTATANIFTLIATHAELFYGPGLADRVLSATSAQLPASDVHGRYLSGRPRVPPPWIVRSAWTWTGWEQLWERGLGLGIWKIVGQLRSPLHDTDGVVPPCVGSCVSSQPSQFVAGSATHPLGRSLRTRAPGRHQHLCGRASGHAPSFAARTGGGSGSGTAAHCCGCGCGWP